MHLIITTAFGQYLLKIEPVDKDTAFIKKIGIQTSFNNQQACFQYVNNITTLLQTKGYVVASVDTAYFDSSIALIKLFVGPLYKLTYLNTTAINKTALQQAGWSEKKMVNKALNITEVKQLQENLLNYYEENGYPFAKVKLDSLIFEEDKLTAKLQIEKGALYKIDSLRLIGTAKINTKFLQRYLNIKNGSTYQKSKLLNINKRLLELPYLQQQQSWDLTLLATGAIINLYLQPKKSSQVNVLVGFLPANQSANNGYEQVRTKLLFTGEANINLQNALGNGEVIGLNWQQIQQKSPRLNLQYQQPYLAGSAFGITTSFDLLKKDSSYLNLNFIAGLQYFLSVNQTGKIFIQTFRSNLLSIDTIALKSSKKLPNQIDLSTTNFGVEYGLNKTNYKFNPKKGYELQLSASIGTRKIRKNNLILKLSDVNFSYASLYDTFALNTYQFRIKTTIAKYLPLSRQSTLKIALNSGWLQSPNVFRNELFQIGGYKLMRGFDEESIFASQYAVSTTEYRYLIGLNSYFFIFGDFGLTKNKNVNAKVNSNTYIGAGLGLAFETKAGFFNISYASGKRNDIKFDIRQSKIHIGYVNYF